MSCCGQKRASLSGSTYQRAREKPYSKSQPPAEKPPSNQIGTTPLRYLGNDAISLRGPYTGHAYYFSEAGNVIAVHDMDIDALLRTQLFVREE